VTDSLVKTESVKPAAHAVLTIATSMLSEIAGAFIVVGITLMAAAWFAGPARLAIRARRAIAPFLRDRPEWTYGIVAAVMALIFIWQPIPATGKLGGIIVLLVLAFLGTYVLRRQTATEFPDA
jgi:ABC-type xylose transport system permease subunit